MQPSRHHLTGNAGSAARAVNFNPEDRRHPITNRPQITQISDFHNLRNL
jgi:hypothetical protein